MTKVLMQSPLCTMHKCADAGTTPTCVMDKGPDPAGYILEEQTINVPKASFPRPVLGGERPGQQS